MGMVEIDFIWGVSETEILVEPGPSPYMYKIVQRAPKRLTACSAFRLSDWRVHCCGISRK